MNSVQIPCRSGVAKPGECVKFALDTDPQFIWIDVQEHDLRCSAKISVQDFYDVARLLGIALPDKNELFGARLETLKDIHAALGKIIG